MGKMEIHNSIGLRAKSKVGKSASKLRKRRRKKEIHSINSGYFKLQPKPKKKPSRWTKEKINDKQLKKSTWTKVESGLQERVQIFFSQGDHPYSKITHTQKEYGIVCRNLGWSQEETDLLIELCIQFDCDFIHVTDRYNSMRKSMTQKPQYLELNRQNSFIVNRCHKQDISRQDLVLTMGGVFGYNCGYGVVVKDDLRRLPLPKSGILANMPSQAVSRVHRVLNGGVSSRRYLMNQSLKFCVNCGPEEKTVNITHPKKASPQPKDEKTLIPEVDNALSGKVEQRINQLVGVNFLSQLKTPTAVVGHMYDRLRADVVTLVALETLIKQKEARYKFLKQRTFSRKNFF